MPAPPAEGVIRMRTIPMLVCEYGEYADSEMGVKHGIVIDNSVTSPNKWTSTFSLLQTTINISRTNTIFYFSIAAHASGQIPE